MRYGGLGGLGGLTPTRQGTPNSGHVMSDDEFTADWMAKQPNQYIETPTGEMTAPTVGRDHYDGRIARLVAMDPGAFGSRDAYDGRVPETPEQQQARLDFAANPSAAIQASRTPIIDSSANPAWADWNNNFESAQGLRQENQTRQQQAYGQMTNNGAENGLIPQNYSQAGFGQVSGQNSAFNSDGGTQLGGVDNSWTSGAYTPQQGGSGVYQPTPYSASTFNKNKNWQL